MNKTFSQSDFTNRVFIAVCVVAATVIGLLVLFFAADVFLLLFAGILFSVALKGAGRFIHHRTRFSEKVSVLIVLVLLLLGTTAVFRFFIPTISAQIDQLSKSLPQSLEQASEAIMKIEWLRGLITTFNGEYLLPRTEMLIGKTAPLITNVLGGMVGFLLILMTGFYFSMHSETYSKGFLKLIPLKKRNRVRDFFSETASKLRLWMIGQLCSMLFFGTLITLGLSFLNVPLALILGIIAGFLAFIPNFGFLISLIPAVLLGFTVSPQMAVYVLLLYIVANTIETYIFTPWVQFHAVSLPPILIIFPQILLGLVFGFLGLFLATPLTLTICIFLKYFYIEDVLGDRKN